MVAKDAQEYEDNKSYIICGNMYSKTTIFDKYICKYEKKHKIRYTFGPEGVPNELIDLEQRLNDAPRCPINKYI